MFTAIDIYCERTDAAFWSEPVNALTNLAFVIAGLWGVRETHRNRAGPFAQLLAWWVVAIGVGSALFHTFANSLTIWFDIVPIAGFVFAYTLFNLRHFLGIAWPRALAVFVAFYAAAGLATWLVPETLVRASNGSTGYLPALLALIFFGAWEAIRGIRAGWYNLAAAGLFIVSAFFRAIDPAVCQTMPLGTHFLWHTLNGLMLGILLAAVAWHGGPPVMKTERP